VSPSVDMDSVDPGSSTRYNNLCRNSTGVQPDFDCSSVQNALDGSPIVAKKHTGIADVLNPAATPSYAALKVKGKQLWAPTA
jgi:hypothetical protein